MFLIKLLNLLTLNNSERIIFEFVGNPGSGKSTIIRTLLKKYENDYTNNKIFHSGKFNKLFDKLIFFVFSPFIFLHLIIKLEAIIFSFLHPEQNNIFAIFARRKKIYLICLRMLYQIYKSNSKVIFTESILHQITNLNIDKNIFFNKVINIYGYPKLCFVFIKINPEISMCRMLSRGDEINLNNINIQNRYKNSYKLFIELFQFLNSDSVDNNTYLRPVLLDSKNDPNQNAIIIDKIVRRVI